MAVTALSFYGILNDSFTNWDDDVYVTGNILIRSLSWQHILRIFSPATFVNGNYQPITILSYALSYAAGKLDPAGYILVDLLIHLLNIFLVFIFIRKIFRSDFVASFCALLFGIHPMHVESVVWISGRKDLLYTFFYLASSLLYLSYLEKKKGSATLRYSASCILFVCSLLSKSAAVTLPVVLFLIDYCRVRKFSVKMVIDKIPFFVSAIILGLWAIKGQHDAGTFGGLEVLPVFTRISIACYSFMFYFVKFFIPLKLSAYYPYPASFPISLPLRYSLSPLFAVTACMAAWYFRRSKAFIFGFGFFLVNVIFILHFIPVSSAVTTDRFSYLAYLGLSSIVAHYVEKGIASFRLKGIRVAVYAAICFVTFIFGYVVHERCKVWRTPATLWTDVIGKYPSAIAYNDRGYAYYLNHDYARALEDYNTGLSQYSSYADLYNNRGVLYDALGDHARAVGDYDRAIANKPGFADAYNNRGVDYCANGDYERAMNDFNRAISLNPGCTEAYCNRATILNSKGDYAGALADYSRAISLNPENAGAWYSQGRIYKVMNDLDRALTSLTRAIEIDSAFEHAYNSRGVIYCLGSDFDRAIVDFNRAISLKPLIPDAYFNRGNAYSSKGNYQQAINDFSSAISLDSAKSAQAFFNRGLAWRAIGDFQHAVEDFRRACAMHFDYACRALEGDNSNLSVNNKLQEGK
jgi:tetratricopeptide (TPR) repeat protein